MEKKPELKRNIFRLVFLLMIFVLAANIIHYSFTKENDQVINRQKNFEQVLRSKEQQLQVLLEKVLNIKDTISTFQSIFPDLPPDLWQDQGIAILLYRNDSLVYWSDNNVPAENTPDKQLFFGPFMHYANGWFRVITEKDRNLKAIGLALVKSDFSYQNDYLINDFQKDYNLNANVQLDTIPGKINISANSGEFIFSLDYRNLHDTAFKTHLLVFAFFLLAFITLIILLFHLYQLFEYFRGKPLLLLLAFGFDAIFIRFELLYFEIQNFIY